MTQRPKLMWVALVAALCGLSGCAATGGVFSGWGAPDEVEVREVRRALACGSTTETVLLTLFDGPTAYAQWEAQRGAQLYGDAVLPAGQYLLVEMGRRGFAGFGMAVSSVARRKGDTLVLRATFIEPGPGAEPGGEAVSPCALIRLPDMAIDRVELVDEQGDRRATLKLEPKT